MGGVSTLGGRIEPTDADRAEIGAALAEAVERLSDPNPTVTAATRQRRVARARELDEIGAALENGRHRCGGHRSAAAWLAEATGESPGQCRSTVAIVSRLAHLPVSRAAFGEGELSESALRLLAEGWSPTIAEAIARDEAMLLGWAQQFTFNDFRDLYDVWRAYADPDDLDATAADQHERRQLFLSKMLDGVGKLDGIPDPEGRRLVREALRALSAPTAADHRTAAQRRADALVDMARITLDQLQNRAELERGAEGGTLFGPTLPTRRQKRNRPKVFATIAYEQLVEGAGAGTVDTHLDRDVVSAESIRRLACDAGVHRLVTSPLGTVIDHGRERRVVSDTQFDRLHLRDHGCRWPGCAVPAGGCDAHHADHWLAEGETVDENLVLLCWHHHHTLHEDGWSMKPLGAGYFSIESPDGRMLLTRPPTIGAALPAA
ncbi:MAG: DUF222 domain-containing protein [Actinomycetota bacterium]